jgi:putative ABC transport system ATP-binding protein
LEHGKKVMIKVSDLFKSVPVGEGVLEILKGISFEIKSGESSAIVGVSGSGKSTLLGLLAGLDTATAGDVVIDGVSLADLNEDKRAALRAEKVGFVFQNFQLLPALTALENVMLPLELSGAESPAAKATEFLQKVGLADRLMHYPATLSGGEQQRVAIARAFAAEPMLLFADEPTGNLDGDTAEKIIELLFSLNASAGTTLILVTHDQRLAARCGRRFSMESGRLSEVQ